MYQNHTTITCAKYSLFYLHDKPFTIKWCHTIAGFNNVIYYIMILFFEEYNNLYVDWNNISASLSYFMANVIMQI